MFRRNQSLSFSFLLMRLDRSVFASRFCARWNYTPLILQWENAFEKVLSHLHEVWSNNYIVSCVPILFCPEKLAVLNEWIIIKSGWPGTDKLYLCAQAFSSHWAVMSTAMLSQVKLVLETTSVFNLFPLSRFLSGIQTCRDVWQGGGFN